MRRFPSVLIVLLLTLTLALWLVPGCGESDNERAFVASVPPGKDKPDLSGLSYADRRGKMKEISDQERAASKQKKGARQVR